MDIINTKGLFDALARDYHLAEILSWGKLRCWRRQILYALPLSEGMIVYDLGCGTGNNFEYLVGKVGNSGKVFGVDFSEKMLELAQQRMIRHRWHQISLIRADFLSQDWGEIPADVIISTFCLKTIPIEAYVRFAQRIAAVLKPNGCCILGEFSMPPQYFRALLTRFYLKYVIGTIGGWMGAETYIQLYVYVKGYDNSVYLAQVFDNHCFISQRFSLSKGWITGIKMVKPVSG